MWELFFHEKVECRLGKQHHLYFGRILEICRLGISLELGACSNCDLSLLLRCLQAQVCYHLTVLIHLKGELFVCFLGRVI